MLKKLLPISLLNFSNILTFSLLIPILPEITEQQVQLRFQEIVFGVLISLYAICQFFAAPIFGSISDKYGRKPILVIGQIFTTLGWAILAFAFLIESETVYWGIALPIFIIALARVVDGIAGGNSSVANAWISDTTTKSEKTKAFGIMGAVYGGGFLLGPAIGGFIASTELGYLGVAGFAATVCLITLLALIFMLPESLPKQKRDDSVDVDFKKEFNIWWQFNRFADIAKIRSLLKLRFFYYLVFASFTTVVTLLLTREYGFDPRRIGFFLSLMGIFVIFNQLVIAPVISARKGDLWMLKFAVIIICFALILIPQLPRQLVFDGKDLEIYLLALIGYVLTLGLSLAQLAFKSLLLNNVTERKQGKIAGLDESLLALGNSLAPAAVGVAYSFIGINTFVLIFIGLAIPFTIFIWKARWLTYEEGKSND